MHITIIQDDGVVGVDGVFRAVNLSDLDPAYHAVHYDTVAACGHIEHDEALDPRPPNLPFGAASWDLRFAKYFERWLAAAPVKASAAKTTEELINETTAVAPDVDKATVDRLLAADYRGLVLSYQRRPADNRLLGVLVASIKGAEVGAGTQAALALRRLTEDCLAAGVPVFGAVATDPAHVSQADYLAFLSGFGYRTLWSQDGTDFVVAAPDTLVAAKAADVAALQAAFERELNAGFISAAIVKLRIKRGELAAAATVEEVDAIIW